MSRDLRHISNLRLSLWSAAVVPVALMAWFILDALHVPPNPLQIADNARVGKAFVCVVVAAMATMVSVLCAIYPLLCRDWRPIVWLIVLGIAWSTFDAYYNHADLMRGKAPIVGG